MLSQFITQNWNVNHAAYISGSKSNSIFGDNRFLLLRRIDITIEKLVPGACGGGGTGAGGGQTMAAGARLI